MNAYIYTSVCVCVCVCVRVSHRDKDWNEKRSWRHIFSVLSELESKLSGA